MSKPQCGNCRHYRQHYSFDHAELYRVFCGHCTKGRRGKKLPDAKSCELYEAAEPMEEVFVRKEYLSKALLHHILSMELLPEIKDAPER